MFSAADITIDIEDVDSDVALITITTPIGVGEMLGRVRIEGRTMLMDRVHVDGLRPGLLGRAGIMLSCASCWWKPMSKDLSFREKLARPADTSANGQVASSSRTDVTIERSEFFAHPVALAKLFRDNGLRLADAHDAVTRLTNDRMVTVSLRPSDLDTVLSEISAFGLRAFVPDRKHAVVR